MTLALTDITINGQMIDTTTGDVSQASSSRGARTAKVVGGATALGAIIGALAGGGRGAAIGAASGAAVGGGARGAHQRSAGQDPVRDAPELHSPAANSVLAAES